MNILQKDMETTGKSPFPTLENLAKDFHINNMVNLGYNPMDTAQTQEGIILSFGGDNLVLLSVNPSEGINYHRPPLRGTCQFRKSFDIRNYTLSGRLKGEQVLLQTAISETQKYNCAPVIPLKIGEPRVAITRLDNHSQYWFIALPNQSKKD